MLLQVLLELKLQRCTVIVMGFSTQGSAKQKNTESVAEISPVQLQLLNYNFRVVVQNKNAAVM